MDAMALSTLTRTELQVLAKANGIRANLKNAKIISELLKVLPTIVPLEASPSREPPVNRHPHAPSPSLGPDLPAHTLPTPNRLPVDIQLPVAGNAEAGQIIRLTAESISQVLGGYQGGENPIALGRSPSPVEEPSQGFGGRNSHPVENIAEEVSAHNVSQSNRVEIGAQVPGDLGDSNPFVTASTPEPDVPQSPNGSPPPPHSTDLDPVRPYEAVHAVEVLRNISYDHMSEYNRIRLALDDVDAIKERTKRNRQLLTQERAMRIRMENYVSYWQDVAPTWKMKDVYSGTTTAAKFRDGTAVEAFSCSDISVSDPPSPQESVEFVDAPVRELYNVQVSPASSEPDGRKRSRQVSSSADEDEDDIDNDDSEGSAGSPLARKRPRLAPEQDVEGHASPAAPGSDDDAQNVASLLTTGAPDSVDLEHEDHLVAPSPRSSTLEPAAGPSQPLRRSFRQHSLPLSSPPRLSAAQKGKGRA